jgi:hypothetical protein
MKGGRYLKSVRDALPAAVRAHFDKAFAGDALAARRLMIVAPKRLRGHIAFLAYQAKLGNPAYRAIIRAVWLKESRHLLTGFWRQEVVRRMLTRADFSRPELSGPVAIYRALGAADTKRASAELCWSLSRERTLLKAFAASPERPRLLQATIDASEIVYWSQADGEQEVVSRRPVQGAAIVDVAGIRSPVAVSQTG